MVCVMAGCGAWSRCRWAAGPALSKSRMQFTNTSDVTPQTDINQHNTGGELHAKLRNDEQHTSTSCGARWEAAAWPAGPGRGAGGRWLGLAGLRDRPLRAARLACGDLAGGPPPTGTYSGPAQQNRPRGGRKSVRATSNARHQTGQRQHEAARPHRGRAAHASGRKAALSDCFSASGCRRSPGAGRPRRRGRPCRPRPTCPTCAGRTASSRRPRRRS